MAHRRLHHAAAQAGSSMSDSHDSRDPSVPERAPDQTDEGGGTIIAPPTGATPVSRRAALKVLGAVPLAGALVGGSAFAQQGTPQSGQQQPKQTHEATAQ